MSKRPLKAGSSMSSDDAMLEDIRQLLKESQELRARTSKQKPIVKTPYGKYQHEIVKVNRADQISSSLKLAKKEVIGTEGKMKQFNLLEVDDKLRSIAIASAFDRENTGTIDSNTMGKLSVLQPFSQSLHKIDSYLTVDQVVTDKTKANSNTIPSTTTSVQGDDAGKPVTKVRHGLSTRYLKKYARFCSNLQQPQQQQQQAVFTDADLTSCSLKKDLWMVHFMETCYDNALDALYTPLAHNKKVNRHFGLDTGSLDSFPTLVAQVIARVLGRDPNVFKKSCLEFLLSIEKMAEDAEQARFRHARDATTFVFDGGRALLFTKFLSEEYDLDVFVVFLSGREVLQKELRLPLNKVNTIMMKVDQGVLSKAPMVLSEFLDQTQSFVMSLDDDNNDDSSPHQPHQAVKRLKRRLIPHELTHSLHSHSQPPTFQSHSLTLNSHSHSGASFASFEGAVESAENKLQFSERVVPQKLPAKWCFMHDLTLPDTPILGFDIDLLLHFISLILPTSSVEERVYFAYRVKDTCAFDLLQEGKKEEKRQKIAQIPLYSFLRTLCLEWRKVSTLEKKRLFVSTEQASKSLVSLHEIYRDKCQLLRLKRAEIEGISAQVQQCKANILKLETRKKRLLRKFNVDRTASHEEQEELSQITESIALEVLEQRDVSRLLQEKEDENRSLQVKIDELWQVVMDDTPPDTKHVKKPTRPKERSRPSSYGRNMLWKETMGRLMALTIKENIARQAILRAPQAQLQQQLLLHESRTKEKQSFVVVSNKQGEKEELKLLTHTLARVVSRHAIVDGTRKIILRSFLNAQRQTLLLQLGDVTATKQELQRQQLLKEQSQLLLLRKLAVSLSSIIAPDFITNSVIKPAIKLAFNKLFDPWYMLDLEVEVLVPGEKTRLLLTHRFLTAQQKRRKFVLEVCFRTLKLDFNFKVLRSVVERKVVTKRWRQFRFLFAFDKNYLKLAVLIQRQSRVYLFKKRLSQHISHQSWVLQLAKQHFLTRIKNNTQLRTRYLRLYMYYFKHDVFMKRHAYHQVKHALLERRFLICFYTWLHNWRNRVQWRLQQSELMHKSTISIQAIIRMHIAVQRRKKYYSALKLQLWSLQVIARRKTLKNRLQSRRLEYDFEQHISCQHKLYKLKFVVEKWKKASFILRGLQKVHSAVSHYKQRKNLRKWHEKAVYQTRYLELFANKISGLFRMFWVFKKKVRYYKFRKAIRKLQSNIRRRQQMRNYRQLRLYVTKTRVLQRVFRGYQTRKFIFHLRLFAIQKASFDNHYSKLKFYIQRYPDLVVLPEKETGDNCLHLAARGAAKRTLKLLLKSRLFDANGGNYKGYSPLHLLIVSDSPHRDDLFTYMLEHGFDDDQVTTSDGCTCLLLACRTGHSFIVRTLLDDGHDPNIPNHAGLTPLAAACRGGYTPIVQFLLDEAEAKVDIPGELGAYALHEAVIGGEVEIVRMLLAQPNIEVDCVTDSVASSAQTPLIWAAIHGRYELMRLLLIHGAQVNYVDGYGRSAAHYAALYHPPPPPPPPPLPPLTVTDTEEEEEEEETFMLLDEESNSQKSKRVSLNLFEVLREADCDFELADYDGNTPLHLAAMNESIQSTFAVQLLHSGVYPSPQNNIGDQPSHIACRYDKVEFLQSLSEYDMHIGRRNYNRETPLGVARTSNAENCIAFLVQHYLTVEDEDCRDSETGELHWDNKILENTRNWVVEVNADNSRLYRNILTNEVSTTPPAVSFDVVQKVTQKAEMPVYRKVQLVKEENNVTTSNLTRHKYLLDAQTQKGEISEMSKDYHNANIIIKYARRKLARNLLIRLKNERRIRKTILRFIKRHLGGFMRYRHAVKTGKATAIQSVFRGYSFRLHFFGVSPVQGEYFERKRHLSHRRLRYGLWAMWQRYKRREAFQSLLLVQKHAQSYGMTIADWQLIVEAARHPLRIVGIYEEYKYPNTRQLKFYRHAATGACTLIKPTELVLLDDRLQIEAEEIKQFGATKQQIALVTKLQALWRGYAVRHYSQAVEQALHLCASAEEKYLLQPEVDAHVYNYALFLLTFHQDLDKARRIFVEALRRMQWRGPDIAFVLYSYAIFAMASGDEDYADVRLFLDRARAAEEQVALVMRQKYRTMKKNNYKKEAEELTAAYGKCFDLAHQGFFRYTAVAKHNARGWELLALCRFLVYNNFPGSFDAFMQAFRTEPKNDRIRKSFRIMMTHFHGPDPEVHDDITKDRLRFFAQLDADQEESRRITRDRDRLRNKCAKRIQIWYKECRKARVFRGFLASVRQIIRRESRAVSRQQQRRGVASPAGFSVVSSPGESRRSSRPITANKGI